MKKYMYIVNWLTVIIWGWYLLDYWSLIPVPHFIISNYALTAVFILFLQLFASADFKKIFLLKDKEFNFLVVIAIVTVICMNMVYSKPGAFFTVFNFSLLWYICDKWVWTPLQIGVLSICYTIIFLSWTFIPHLWGPETNRNTTSVITTFTCIVLLTVLEYYFSNKWWNRSIQVFLILLSVRQILIFRGRGALLCLSFYCLCRWAIFRKKIVKLKSFKSISYFLVIGPIIFSALYTMSWHYFRSDYKLPFFNKKIFSGREKIWSEFWLRFLEKPFTGTGTNFTLTSYFEFNVHNAMFDILAVHGIIVFILVVVFFIRKLMLLYSQQSEHALFVPVIAGVFSVMLESFTEMDMLWSPLFLIWSFILLIFNSSISTKNTVDNGNERKIYE